jgi:hypothetical protein
MAMKTKQIYFSLAILVVAFLSFSAFTSRSHLNTGANSKVIKFSHELHSAVVACEDCHSGVMDASSLNTRLLPEKSVCAGCHDVQDADKCNTCHFPDVYEPLKQQKSKIIFNHSFHLKNNATKTNGEKCLGCHKDINLSVEIDVRGKYNPTMDACWTCHADTKLAANACEACHISTAGLTPQTHKLTQFATKHKFSAMAPGANCMMCHDNTSCQECHTANSVMTEGNTTESFFKPGQGSNFTDGPKVQTLSRVHDLNFRFTHGIDFRGKASDCTTCHQTESFCSTCHSQEGKDFAYYGLTPISHSQPSFITVGVGSGGGEHARLAKRDLESCTSCHDASGSDPVCVNCHNDPDGIQGTNPKTHAASFFKNHHGDWHSDVNSVCYSCHTDVNAKPNGVPGVAFCSYCHGNKKGD